MHYKRFSFLLIIFLSISTNLIGQEVEEFVLPYQNLADRVTEKVGTISPELYKAIATVNRTIHLPENYKPFSDDLVDLPGDYGIYYGAESLAKILISANLTGIAPILLIGRETSYLANILTEMGLVVYIIDPVTPGPFAYPQYVSRDIGNLSTWSQVGLFESIIVLNSMDSIVPQLTLQLHFNGTLIVPLESKEKQTILALYRKANQSVELLFSIVTLSLY